MEQDKVYHTVDLNYHVGNLVKSIRMVVAFLIHSKIPPDKAAIDTKTIIDQICEKELKINESYNTDILKEVYAECKTDQERIIFLKIENALINMGLLKEAISASSHPQNKEILRPIGESGGKLLKL